MRAGGGTGRREGGQRGHAEEGDEGGVRMSCRPQPWNCVRTPAPTAGRLIATYERTWYAARVALRSDAGTGASTRRIEPWATAPKATPASRAAARRRGG
ncbi:hypothetical protein AVW11_22695 [Streptomyces amritsarensis]|uniref:Uncharacterized protein n=1 Tax=Streptomyces amritsarensis TaxID=681158 RepID=A0ABX3G299_9ACTN|nr:hypothetical protein AVW11_22695 [Streptomyces amritsarensis]